MSLPKLQAHMATENLATIVQLSAIVAFIPLWIFEGFGAALLVCVATIWGMQVMRPGPTKELDRFTGRGQ